VDRQQGGDVEAILVESDIRSLYQELLDAWNRRDAHAFAQLCAEDANVIGFDGSEHNGQAEIEAKLGEIFARHPTAAYVSKIREVRFLSTEVAVLRAVVGMVPAGQHDIKPDVNALQTLVAHRHKAPWRIALFQNTPAAYHGRPELAEQLTAELREALREADVNAR